MSDDRIDPFWEFYYETGIDPTGGELDTGEQEYEEVIEDEEEYVEECCCHQGLNFGSFQEATDQVTIQIRRLNMIEQLPEDLRSEFISQLNRGKDPWKDKDLSTAIWSLPLLSYTAYDVETANECPSSICSMGFVFVRDSKAVDNFYTLVHPEPDYYKWFCQQVHGLGPEDTDNAPNFRKAWNKIRNRIGNKYPLVAHNAGFDEGCTRAAFGVYQMDYPDYQFLDTLKSSRRYFGRSLPNHQLQTSAAACGFDLRQHHNALADAEACAAIAAKTMSLADLW